MIREADIEIGRRKTAQKRNCLKRKQKSTPSSQKAVVVVDLGWAGLDWEEVESLENNS